MKILVLSSRTGAALTMLNNLYPIHTAVTNHKPPCGVVWLPTPKTDREWLALQSLNFELAISLGFMHHIPKLFFEHTPTINVHPGKLPIFKGRDPHIQALKAEAEWTAVTIHKVTEEIDCGEILVEVPVRITKMESIQKLEERLRTVAVFALASLLYGQEGR